jgi:hypothetical protein
MVVHALRLLGSSRAGALRILGRKQRVSTARGSQIQRTNHARGGDPEYRTLDRASVVEHLLRPHRFPLSLVLQAGPLNQALLELPCGMGTIRASETNLAADQLYNVRPARPLLQNDRCIHCFSDNGVGGSSDDHGRGRTAIWRTGWTSLASS